MFVSVMPSHGGTHARVIQLRYIFKELKAPKPPPPPKKKLKKKKKEKEPFSKKQIAISYLQ